MIFFYIMLAMLSALTLAGAVVTVFKMGEKELICKYGQEEKR
jgi:hypothetical protein